MDAVDSALRFGENTHDGVTLRYAAMGRADAPLILMLHGFPEYWAAWRPVMERLADRFFVVAPDQRGYNKSSRPGSVEQYRIRPLVADIAALADTLSPDKPFILAGHDWGASVAYAYAFSHPDRLTHLVIANGVHPACFQRAIFDDPDQREASQYMTTLRSAGIEERLSEGGYRRLMRMIAGFSNTGWMDDAEAAAYRTAWGQPGALTAMLNWYRASQISVPAPDGPVPDSSVLDLPAEAMTVRVPHLVIWGEADTALRPSCLDGLDEYAADLTVRKLGGTGHWILHEKPDEAAAAIAAFVQR